MQEPLAYLERTWREKLPNVNYHVGRLRTDRSYRKRVVVNYRQWLHYFQECEKRPEYFVRKPLQAEEMLLHLLIDAAHFEEEEFPEIFETITQLRNLVVRTLELRRAAQKVALADPAKSTVN